MYKETIKFARQNETKYIMRAHRFLWGLLATGLMSSCQFETFEERCQREAMEYTEKQCPRRMDDYTVMDSVTFDMAQRILTYHYTIEGDLDNDTVLTPQAIAHFQEILGEEVKNSVELKHQKEEGVTFRYTYHSKTTGKQRFNVVYDKEFYGH
jgi:ADP-ribose pyrophosphatase YjhB (NUDIX family)